MFPGQVPLFLGAATSLPVVQKKKIIGLRSCVINFTLSYKNVALGMSTHCTMMPLLLCHALVPKHGAVINCTALYARRTIIFGSYFAVTMHYNGGVHHCSKAAAGRHCGCYVAIARHYGDVASRVNVPIEDKVSWE